jgi:lysophospholipase L1-like esterase
MGRRTRSVIGSLVLLSVSLMVAFMAAEIALRVLGHRGEPRSRISNIYRVDDAILDWRYVPNSEVQSGRVTYRYNATGFRDVDHEVRKPAGVHRIVVLGDSVTEGYGVDWGEVFAPALQARLGRGHEVINIAAGGLNTPQEVHLLERVGFQYEPDLVVVNFVLNDVDFYTKFDPAVRAADQADSRIAMLNLTVPPGVKRTLKSSAAIYFLRERFEALHGRLTGSDGERDYYEQLWASEANRRKVTEGFARLATLQRQGRFEVVVMIWPLLADYRTYRFARIHEWVAGEATRVGFTSIDLLPRFASRPYRDLQVSAEDSVHPNALGHRLGVDAFLAWHRSVGRANRPGGKS